MEDKRLKLLLEDGTEMPGYSFGAEAIVGGEVVFNTGMVGYIEALTDPSYRGQILVTTYPLVGNYGVPGPREKDQLSPPYESSQIQVQALVVQNYVDAYSHHAATRSLSQWLINESVPAVTGIDTRRLTRHLREFGTMRGWLVPAAVSLDQAPKLASTVEMTAEVFKLVAPNEVTHYSGNGTNILVIDVGAKDNIIRCLLKRGVSVTRVPWFIDLDEYVSKADGIIIGNGPGDPRDLRTLVRKVRDIIASSVKPVFGICLGNQILALAAGAEIYKLPYGHRGCNQPVQDSRSKRCYITSQNHGYAVGDNSIPGGWEPWFVNVNDGTNEGIRSLSKPFFSVQFHPEASPGPDDTSFLFDDFLLAVTEGPR